MGKFILAILISFLPLKLVAQELTIKSFTELTNDITARSNPRNDLNGNPCALVKVRMAIDNATFKGMVVGEVRHEGSEYYVYLPEGAKKITVSAPNYLPIDVKFEGYGIGALVAKTTYLLTLSNGTNNATTTQIERTQTGWIVLNSEPNDADVYINNEYVGKTPLGNCKKTYGHYKYKIEKNNYHISEGEFDLMSAKYQNTVLLKPAFGTINIKSEVSGITIYLDGQQISQTSSCVLENIASGSHTLSIQKDKYAPFKQTIVVKDGEETLVNANMMARFSNITIKSLVGAQIHINGTFKGCSSINEDLMEGFYDVEVKKEHHVTATKQIEVKAGVNQVVNIEPTPILCTLDVVSRPVDASVNIDGVDYGTTPCTIESLLEGPHIIKVVLNKYKTVQQEIILRSNENNVSSFQLEENKEIPIVQMDENLKPQKEEGDEGEIFEVVEQQPAFPGGNIKLMEWLSENLQYPEIAIKFGIESRLVVNFVVDKDGAVIEPKIIKGVKRPNEEEIMGIAKRKQLKVKKCRQDVESACSALEKEVIRVILSMPKWQPAKQRGKAVRAIKTLPVTFKFK